MFSKNIFSPLEQKNSGSLAILFATAYSATSIGLDSFRSLSSVLSQMWTVAGVKGWEKEVERQKGMRMGERWERGGNRWERRKRRGRRMRVGVDKR